jgi:hypothetical protein
MTAAGIGPGVHDVRPCSGMTPELTGQDETANKGDDCSADGFRGDHAGQQEARAPE